MTPLRLVIVGGVAGGMSAAARARRVNEQAQITVIERGGFISLANCGLPYYIAGRIAGEEKLLVTTAGKVRQRFNIEVRLRTEALGIDRTAKTVLVRNHITGRQEELPYDKLILAPGALPILPPLAGARATNVFTIRSLEETRALQKYLEAARPKHATVIGAGFIGLEMAEALHERGMAVTVVEKAGHALPPIDAEIAVDVHDELAANGVTLIAGTGLAALQTDALGRVNAAALEDGRRIETELVVLSIGVRPNVGLAKAAGLRIGESGAIAVDTYQRTSDPDIYAVGDAAEVIHGVTGMPARIPLAGPANRLGRLAGEHAASGRCTAPAGAQMGTAIVRVFALSVGCTGLSELAARSAGFDVDTAYVTANQHAGYYPGATPIRLKLIYDKSTGRVLGAQAVGREGVDKRLDVIATVLHFKGTIDDLAALDLAYAPQFGSAKDPVHMAAFVAQNQRGGMTPAIAPEEIDGRQLVDVRTPEEYARGHLGKAIPIPLDSLRQRVGELNAARPTAVYCQAGLRGHIATRILKQRGFADVVNVKGGYALATKMQAP